MKNILQQMIQIADECDKNGLYSEADQLDKIMKKIAEGIPTYDAFTGEKTPPKSKQVPTSQRQKENGGLTDAAKRKLDQLPKIPVGETALDKGYFGLLETLGLPEESLQQAKEYLGLKNNALDPVGEEDDDVDNDGDTDDEDSYLLKKRLEVERGLKEEAAD